MEDDIPTFAGVVCEITRSGEKKTKGHLEERGETVDGEKDTRDGLGEIQADAPTEIVAFKSPLIVQETLDAQRTD